MVKITWIPSKKKVSFASCAKMPCWVCPPTADEILAELEYEMINSLTANMSMDNLSKFREEI